MGWAPSCGSNVEFEREENIKSIAEGNLKSSLSHLGRSMGPEFLEH